MAIADHINRVSRRIPPWTIYIAAAAWAGWLFWLGLSGNLGPEPINAAVYFKHGGKQDGAGNAVRMLPRVFCGQCTARRKTANIQHINVFAELVCRISERRTPIIARNIKQIFPGS